MKFNYKGEQHEFPTWNFQYPLGSEMWRANVDEQKVYELEDVIQIQVCNSPIKKDLTVIQFLTIVRKARENGLPPRGPQ